MVSNLNAKRKLSKLSSEALLKKVSQGNMSKADAKEAASILEKRFPSPKS